jgi:hypothetical protein
VPAEHGLGLDDPQHPAPGAHAAGQQHQEQPVQAGERRAFVAAAKHDLLLAEQGVLGDLVRSRGELVAEHAGCLRLG